jgi:hypothetical protein
MKYKYVITIVMHDDSQGTVANNDKQVCSVFIAYFIFLLKRKNSEKTRDWLFHILPVSHMRFY